MFVNAGSRCEVNHVSGVSHFLHKLAFQVSARSPALYQILQLPPFVYIQSTERFSSRELLANELDQYGGVFDCQRSRDVMIYSLSVFSFALPQAMEILADCIWRPRLTPEEVITGSPSN